MKLVIDDETIDFQGKPDDLYRDVANLLVSLENRGDLPVQKALKIIGVYALLIKSGLL